MPDQCIFIVRVLDIWMRDRKVGIFFWDGKCENSFNFLTRAAAGVSVFELIEIFRRFNYLFLFFAVGRYALSFYKNFAFKFYLEWFYSHAALRVVTYYLNITLVSWKVLITIKYNLCYGFSAT